MIEGNQQFNSTLAAIGQPFEIAIAGDEHKQVTFYKSKTDHHKTGSTIFLEDNIHFENDQLIKEVVQMKKIDSIVTTKGFMGRVNFIKIDVQGAELLALRGAVKTLKTVDFILCEVPILQYNKGSPSFYEIHMFFEKIDFVIYDVWDTKYIGSENELRPDTVKVNNDGFYGYKLFQMDILWVRRSSKYYQRDCTGFDPYEKIYKKNYKGDKILDKKRNVNKEISLKVKNID